MMGSVKTLDRRLLVAAASLWTLACFAVAVGYHINEPPGVQSITLNGHTYVGSPPALSLMQRDPNAVLLAAVLVLVAILVAAVDVDRRRRRDDRRPGVASVIVGVLLVLFSLFGLGWGLASLGVVGLLVVLASRPITPAVAP